MLLFCHERPYHRQGSGCLQVFSCIADISEFRRLDCSSQYFMRPKRSPELHLKNKFLKWASLHLRLWILRDSVLIKRLRTHSEDKSICHTTGSSCSLLGWSLWAVVKLEGLTLTDRVIVEFLREHKVKHILDVRNGDRALSDVGRNDDLSSASHQRCISESLILFFGAQGWVKRDQFEMVYQPLSWVKISQELHKLENFMETR